MRTLQNPRRFLAHGYLDHRGGNSVAVVFRRVRLGGRVFKHAAQQNRVRQGGPDGIPAPWYFRRDDLGMSLTLKWDHFSHPVGMSAISRGLSAAIPPEFDGQFRDPSGVTATWKCEWIVQR